MNRLCAILLLLSSCSTKQTGEPVEYRGPLREASNVDMLYAEKDRIKIKLIECVFQL